MEKEDQVLPETKKGGLGNVRQNTTADRPYQREEVDRVPSLLEEDDKDQEQIQACVDHYYEDLIDFQVDVILGYKEQRWMGYRVLKVRVEVECGVWPISRMKTW